VASSVHQNPGSANTPPWPVLAAPPVWEWAGMFVVSCVRFCAGACVLRAVLRLSCFTFCRAARFADAVPALRPQAWRSSILSRVKASAWYVRMEMTEEVTRPSLKYVLGTPRLRPKDLEAQRPHFVPALSSWGLSLVWHRELPGAWKLRDITLVLTLRT